MTSKEYRACINYYNEAIDAVEYLLEKKVKSIDYSYEFTNYMNNLHDSFYELNEEFKLLDNIWRQKDWTVNDYAHYKLVADNID